jgi:carbon-monoxide dehydrogenase small subunit
VGSDRETSSRIRLTVNGKARNATVRPGETLLDVLRGHLRLTGTKRGCEVGECGACTVVMDGVAVNACLVPAFQADGADVLTVEGLEQDGSLHPLQAAFLDHGAVQCGYCTPGMLMSAHALLRANPVPTRYEVAQALAGNLCRCTGYRMIVDAVMAAADRLRASAEKSA